MSAVKQPKTSNSRKAGEAMDAVASEIPTRAIVMMVAGFLLRCECSLSGCRDNPNDDFLNFP